MIKLVIFDMDGVLVDIKDMHFDTLNDAISEYDPGATISYQEHIHTYDGLKTFDKLKLLTQKKNLSPDLHNRIWRLKQEKTIAYVKNLTGSATIRQTLKQLKDQGFTIAVASNSIRDTVKHVLLSTQYIEYIDFFYSNDDVSLPKPHTEMYLRCMLRAQVSPKETVILEDSPTGIKAAQMSGAHIIQIQNTNDINPSLTERITMISDKPNTAKWTDKKMNIVIPMAGAGSRFEQAGYTFPKPLIEIHGQPMIKVVVDNINIDANYIFIVQKQHYDKYNLQYLLNIIAPNCTIIPIDSVTQGAACTVLLAKEFIDNDNPLLLANSDQYVEWNSYDFMYNATNTVNDGCLLTFQSVHPKWSYAKLDADGYVSEVAEKKPISDIATVGIYYWRQGCDFVKYAERMIDKNIRVNNEFYVCPVYNEGIIDGQKYKTYHIDHMWGLGTPDDLNYFVNSYHHNK